MAAAKSLVRVEAVAAIVSFAMIFVCGLLRQVAIRSGMEEKTADGLSKGAILLFFCIFGFSCIGLMIHAFIALQVRIGNTALPMVRFLADHEIGVILGFWGILGTGTLIALPVMWNDMFGGGTTVAASRRVLVADIGMTIDEVKARSTVKIKEPRVMGDGSRMGVEDLVFDYQIGDSPMRFPQSRYYWLETPKNDPHIHVLNIGITPKKMLKTELDAFQHRLQGELLADSWMPGHYLAENEDTVRLWSGRRTAGDGRYWTKNNTLLIFERNRMDEEKRGEPPGSGEYILYINLRPKGNDPKLVFERSAWPN